MNVVKETSKSFVICSITEFLGFFSTFIINFLLIRSFEPEYYALYSFFITFYSFFIMLATLGVNFSIIQKISQLDNIHSKKVALLISEGFKWIILFSFIILSFLIIFSGVFEEIYEIKGLKIILINTSFFLFFSNINFYFESMFQGLRKFKFYAISNISFNCLKIIIVLVALINILPIYMIIGLFTLLSFIHSIIFILIVQLNNKYLSFIFKFNKAETKLFLKFSILVFIPGLFAYLYSKFNLFILGLYVSPEEFAFYSITLMIIEMFSLPIIIFSKSTFPYITNFIKNRSKNKINIDLIYNLIIKYGLLITIPISFLVFTISDNIILILFNYEYLPVSKYLKFCIFYLNVKMIGVVGANFLFAANKPQIVLKLTMITALSSIILSFILIPIFYSFGAIISNIIPHSIYIIYIVNLVRKLNKIKIESKLMISIFKFLISAIVSLSILFGLNFFFRFNQNNLIDLSIFSGFYFGLFISMIIALKAISLTEIKEFVYSMKSTFFKKF